MGADRKPLAARAAVIPARSGGTPAPDAMFEARKISTAGAFLAGTLLLEVDEDFTVELAFDDGATVTTRARVTRVSRGADPGMDVSFLDLPGELEARLRDGERNG